MSAKELLKIMGENYTDAEKKLAQKAYDYAEKAHEGQMRISGDPYITHSLETAIILADMEMDINTIIAGLLHDTVEDGHCDYKDVKKEFGKDVAALVESLTKIRSIKYRGKERYIENLRKMLVAMAKDLRVIIVKLADRLHNLRTLDVLTKEKQQRTALESLEIYAPIAGLLGIWRLRWQIEDLCFKYLDPKNYQKIHEVYGIEKKEEREKYINEIRKIIEKEAKKEGIKCFVNGRFKHYYSIYQKMIKKEINFNEIHDVFALRVIVNDIPECYQVLGIIHKLWKPVRGGLKDYIAVPKPNGYQSLHTTVIGPGGKITEFQIRTKEMDTVAKFGIAAHYHYKTHGSDTNVKQSEWIKNILDLQKQYANEGEEFIKKLKMDVFKDRIFVFTPNNDVFDLPEGATAIDFAYRIHTNIGNKAMGAKINKKFDKLNTELKSGDIVEIVTDPNKKGPSRDWIKYAKTSNARAKIRRALSK